MTRHSMIAIPVVLVAAVVQASQQPPAGRGAAAGPPLTLSTTAFPDGGQIPVKFSQAAPGAAPGEGTSPALSWANVPAGTQSFAQLSAGEIGRAHV